MTVDVIKAGTLPYAEALDLQESLRLERSRDHIQDALLILEHTPVITLGQGGGYEDLHASEEGLRQVGIDLVQTNRGGRATFHGPGQLVAYPILKLKDLDLHAYLWKLEEVVIRVLQAWEIEGLREDRYPGVWIGKAKIAAVGVAVRDNVTMHGLALNVNTDLSFFNWITPCGIQDRGVTSMQSILGRLVPMTAVVDQFVEAFFTIFTDG
jgi:lipoate-protein ligase B